MGVTINTSDFSSAWSKETSHPAYRDRWSEDNPSVGQCAVTALAVQDEYGGDICSCKVGRVSHFVNLVDGKIYDLTSEQFGKKEVRYTNLKVRDRKSLLKVQDVKERYCLLKIKLQKNKEKN